MKLLIRLRWKELIKTILIGNPNVGKSSIFNYLTKSCVHTGNWTGKTVSLKKKKYKYKNQEIELIDLPGTYSITSNKAEEKVVFEYLNNNDYNKVLVICDATNMERSIKILLEILKINKNVIAVINLIDEAKKENILIDIDKLKNILDIDIITTSINDSNSLNELQELIINETKISTYNNNLNRIELIKEAIRITKDVVTKEDNNKYLKLDRILTNKFTGIPLMILLLFLILWLTISISNYPSTFLFNLFKIIELKLVNVLSYFNLSDYLFNLIINGIYKTTTWVISVMLPPMIIFFPLFSFLEEFGILPRIAFNMDYPFSKCNTCGKQCLTMLMGFGCNAVGVSNTKIISNKKERLIAILTNSFIPCNGRFPTLIVIISCFLISNKILSSLILTIFILLSILITLLVSKLLSKLMFKEHNSTFILELPHYRNPKIIKIIKNSLFDRTLKILIKTLMVTIPSGIIIYLLSNTYIDNQSIIYFISNKFNGIAKFMGLDGFILVSFILGIPANEIVLPILLMLYLNTGVLVEYNPVYLKEVLINNNWNIVTAINFLVLSIFHFPCLTTLMTIRKETNKIFYCILSIIIPLFIGVFLTIFINFLIV